jgi:hypothetical integral membrane protein (TIGR02206 family)
MIRPFQLFDHNHLLAIVACFLGLIAVVFYAKKQQAIQHRKRDVWIFTIVFILIEMALITSKVIQKEWSIQYNLPLHLCDFSAFTIIYALHTRSRKAFELGYYWGCVGGLMAIATPNIQTIDWYFVPFFVWHLFLIAGPFYQMLVDNFHLTYKSIYTTMATTLVLASTMMLFNRWLGSNYMFVSEKISSFDALGLPDYPYYLPYLGLIALAMFHVFWAVSLIVRKKQ